MSWRRWHLGRGYLELADIWKVMQGRNSRHTAPKACLDIGNMARRPEWLEQVGERAEAQATVEISRLL